MARKEQTGRILLKSGEAVNVRVMDGIVIDDLVIQGMKAEGYRVVTGKDVFPEITRDVRDYLIKTGVLLD